MALILCIETTTKTCSVGLASDGVTSVLRESRSDGYTHAEQLNVFIDEVMREAGLSYSQLQAIAVSKGPGSYTGLRIGVSAAKGLAYAKNLAIIAVDPLQALASQVVVSQVSLSPQSLLLPMIDARRLEVFCAGYTFDLRQAFDTRAEVLHEESFPEAGASDAVFYFGDGAAKAAALFERQATFHFIDGVHASASGMSSLAEAAFRANDFVDLAYFEPYYLKDFVAGKPKKNRV